MHSGSFPDALAAAASMRAKVSSCARQRCSLRCQIAKSAACSRGPDPRMHAALILHMAICTQVIPCDVMPSLRVLLGLIVWM